LGFVEIYKSMKMSRFSIAVLGSIALVGLPSCTPKPNHPPAETQVQDQQQIKITGAATPYPALQALADAYQAKVENIEMVFLPANQTQGGIVAVQEGLVDLGTVTRQLKPEEENGQLEDREIAKDALLVATHPSVKGVENLTTEQLKAIYSGQVTNWQDVGGPDAEIVLLDRPEDESAKKLLREHYLGKDLQNSPNAVILRDESDLIATVQSTPNSIGAFSLAYAISHHLPVNRLKINGVEPTPDNVRSGQYPMVRTLGIVYKLNPPETVSGFLDFASSPEGSQMLLQSGFVPSTQDSK
jgi:phosphate transport system substrate-binding protein